MLIPHFATGEGKMDEYKEKRQLMVEEQIFMRNVRDEKVLRAMAKVPREEFVPEELKSHAYEDRPLPIPGGQTISQPYIVAYMVEALALRGGEKLLEIGAGSGYAAAVLAEIAAEIYAIERIGQLANFAKKNLLKTGYKNVHIKHADGTNGWQEKGPFDAILVSAGAPTIPKSLLRQLRIGGKMVIPVGTNRLTQELVRIIRKSEDDYIRESLTDVCFVPLIGKYGWNDGKQN